jgi:hypothetical protein
MSAVQVNITQQEILHRRIAFALRRFTGVAYDVDAMLAQRHMRARRVALWREAGCTQLNKLLDQLDSGYTGNRLPRFPAAR